MKFDNSERESSSTVSSAAIKNGPTIDSDKVESRHEGGIEIPRSSSFEDSEVKGGRKLRRVRACL